MSEIFLSLLGLIFILVLIALIIAFVHISILTYRRIRLINERSLQVFELMTEWGEAIDKLKEDIDALEMIANKRG